MALLTIGFLLGVFFLVRVYRRRNRAHAELTAREMQASADDPAR